jgi:hypothetical protein
MPLYWVAASIIIAGVETDAPGSGFTIAIDAVRVATVPDT